MSDAAAGGGSAGAALRAGMVDDFAIEGCPAPVGRYQSVAPTLADQYRSIDHLLRRPSPFANETYAPTACGEFEPGEATKNKLVKETRVLIIGAGGLGCELLKDLALMGFTDLHVIDLDTIDVTNLNRQFLFRMKDVGRPKSEVAAEFVARRVPGVKVTAYRTPVQEFPEAFFKQFRLVIGGLDNLGARRWLNQMLCSLVETDEDGAVADPDTVIPYIDGGTEGFKGQARLILPRITACFDCALELFPPQEKFASCTLASTPRQPAHCIMYAVETLFPRAFGGREPDYDNPDDVQWIYERALERAREYSIEGVTYSMTLGVAKNIIPAIASTNALVSASCALEAFKFVTFASQTINNYHMFMGSDGIHSNTIPLERKPMGDCLACWEMKRTWPTTRGASFRTFLDGLSKDPSLQLASPAVGVGDKNLWIPAPASLRAYYEPNLEKRMDELVEDGEVTFVTDRKLFDGVSIKVTFQFVD